jgi:hypothetical protein
MKEEIKSQSLRVLLTSLNANDFGLVQGVIAGPSSRTPKIISVSTGRNAQSAGGPGGKVSGEDGTTSGAVSAGAEELFGAPVVPPT